jgi:hypothetical protein
MIILIMVDAYSWNPLIECEQKKMFNEICLLSSLTLYIHVYYNPLM